MRILRIPEALDLKPGLNVLLVPGRGLNVCPGDTMKIHFEGMPLCNFVVTVLTLQDSHALIPQRLYSDAACFDAPKGIDTLFEWFSQYDSLADALKRSGLRLGDAFTLLWVHYEPVVAPQRPAKQTLPTNPRPVDPDFAHNFPGVTKAPPATDPVGAVHTRARFECAHGSPIRSFRDDNFVDDGGRDGQFRDFPSDAEITEVRRALREGSEVRFEITQDEAGDVAAEFARITEDLRRNPKASVSFSSPQTRVQVTGIGREVTNEERAAWGVILGYPFEEDA